MSSLKSIELDLKGTRDLALIALDGGVWVVTPVRWWDLATSLWFFFTPSDRRARVVLALGDGQTVHAHAIRVASRHVRVRWGKQ